MSQSIITVAAAKGGVGKTTLAIALASCLDAVLVDLDHEVGGATGQLMSQPAKIGTVLDGLQSGRPPRPWAEEWGRPLVADTAPGHSSAAAGAIAASDLVVVPVPLEVAPIRALAGFLDEWAGYPVMVVPTMAAPRPAPTMVRELARVVGDRYVAEPISEHRFLRRRLRRTSLVLAPGAGAAASRAVAQFRGLAQEVNEWLNAPEAVASTR
ncbi:MAG TPA: ParA family protein [Miltoncostaeaceae bacterium]|nr:ParA family protein [Miltoncostaeaceae bacterium]